MPDTSASSRKALIVVCVAVLACVYVAFPNPRPDLTRFNCDDSEAYIGLANSIAQGRGYTRCLNPDQYLPHKTWPAGLPLALAPVIRAFGLNLLPMKLLMVGIGGVGLCFLYLLVRDTADRSLAAWVALMTACSAHYFWFSRQIMSEVPMLAFSAMVLWMVLRMDREPLRWRWWLLAAMATGYGSQVKGFVLLLIFAPIWVVLRAGQVPLRARLMRYSLFLVVAMIPAVGWGVRNSRVRAVSVDGINQFRMLFQINANDPNSPLVTPRDVLRQTYENVVWNHIYNIPEECLPLVRLIGLRRVPGGAVIASVLTMGLLALGLRTLRMGVWPVQVYLAAVLGVLLWFNTGGSPRYMVPLAPLILFLAAFGLRSSGVWAWLGRWGAVLAWLCLGAAVVDLGFAIRQQERQPYADRHWADYVDMAAEAGRLLPRESVVCVHNPNAFAVVSGRRTWMFQPGIPFEVEQVLRGGQVSHVVVSRYSPARDTDRSRWVRERLDQFEPVASNASYDLYRWKGH